MSFRTSKVGLKGRKSPKKNNFLTDIETFLSAVSFFGLKSFPYLHVGRYHYTLSPGPNAIEPYPPIYAFRKLDNT